MKCIGAVLATIALVICGACARDAAPSQVSPSVLAPSDGGIPIRALDLGPGFLPSANVCPNEAVGGFHANTHRNAVSLTWTIVPGIHDYYVEIERWNVDNAWENALDREHLTVSDRSYLDVPLSPGHYQGRIRTHSVCDALGPWSPDEAFTVTAPPRLFICSARLTPLC